MCIASQSWSRSQPSPSSVANWSTAASDDLLDPLAHLVREVLPLEHGPALLVDHRALLVHDVVVLQDVLAHDEVLLLDLLLRVLDLLREDPRLHGLVLGHLEAGHDVLDPVAGEEPHEVVRAGEEEARLTGVALAAGAAAQLVVDAPRLVALRADDVEPAEVEHLLVVGLPLLARVVHAPLELGVELVGSLLEALGDQLPADLVLLVAAEDDVDAAAGHVRRDRDRALAARLRDDLRLALVLLRVEDVVLDAAARQQLREVLGGLDGDRADEHRLPFLVALGDVVERGGELRLLRAVDEVVAVVARHRHVGGDLRDVEPVDLA